jgi:hypothetical protein
VADNFTEMDVKQLHQELLSTDQQMVALAERKHAIRQVINLHLSRINAAGGHLNRDFEEVYPEGAAEVSAPPAAGVTQFQATATGTIGTPKEG